MMPPIPPTRSTDARSRRRGWTRAGRVLLAGCVAVLPLSCREPEPVATDPTPGPPLPVPEWLAPLRPPDPVRLPASQDTAREAAMTLAAMPPVDDEWTRREVALWAALFAAAHESNVGDGTRHCLITLPDEMPPRLAIDEREFRLRVLAATAGWGVPVAWSEATDEPSSAVEHFPGTREVATRLLVRIVERDPGGDRVKADLSDMTAGIGGSRQRVTATWDGSHWSLERDAARIVW
jgi:hypothetical protein